MEGKAEIGLECKNAARLGGVFSLDLMNWIAC